MAIDPGISLQAGSNVPPADPYGAANKAMSLVDLMQKTSMQPQILQANLENTQAATAGQELLNHQTARDQEARERLAEIAKANTHAVNGVITPDYIAIGNQAASEGMDPQTVFNYLNKGQEYQQGQLKTAGEQRDFANNILSTINNLTRTQTDPTQAVQIVGAGHALLNKTIGKDNADKYFSTYFNAPSQPPVTPNPDGTPFTGAPDPQAPPGTPGSLDTKTFGTHLIQQAQINSRSAAPVAEQGFDDPTSDMSKQAQGQLKTARPDLDPAQISKLTYRQIQADPGLSKSITENIIPGATKAAAIGGPVVAEQQAQTYDNIAALAGKSSSVLKDIPIADIIADRVSPKVRKDENYMAFRSALLDAQKSGNLSEDIMPLTPEAAVKTATAKAALIRKQGQVPRALANPTYTGAAAAAPTGQPPAAPTAAPAEAQPQTLNPGDMVASKKDHVLLKVLTPAQVKASPPGTRFMTTDGRERVSK